MTTETIDVLC